MAEESRRSRLLEFNPLKSITIPHVGRIEPKGLKLVIGPNSAGKTQLLRDIRARVLGQARELVVCDDIEIARPNPLEPLIDALLAEGHIRRRVDESNNAFIDPLIPDFSGHQATGPQHEPELHRLFRQTQQSATAGGRKGTTDRVLDFYYHQPALLETSSRIPWRISGGPVRARPEMYYGTGGATSPHSN